MKSELILDAIGKADDKYIEEAAPKRKSVKKYNWVKWGVLAACLAVAVYTGSMLIPAGIFKPNVSGGTGQTPARTSEPGTSAVTQPAPTGTSEPNATVGAVLSMLTITPETGTMGFEACMAHDISELDNGNPWTTNTKLDSMPVYKNTAYTSAGMAAPGIGKERMMKLAEQAAAALNMKITSFKNETSDDKSNSHTNNGVISGVTATTTAAEINVTGNGTITVSYNDGVELPKEYIFTYTNPSNEKAGSAADYLAERFSKFLSFNKTQKALFADYTFDGKLNRSYYAYDANGNITEQIINFNFNKVQFAPDDNGKLMLIRKFNDLSCAERIGDYPIITLKEASKLLDSGNYLTSVPEKMPGEKYVAKAELVYRTASSNETFLPYYRFWVELPDMQQKNSLKSYGAYYVPAVQKQYISNMPLWNGSFN